jgi:hypothetical protein
MHYAFMFYSLFNVVPKLFDTLHCPKSYLLFTADDTVEEHCYIGASLLLNQRVFDWLDETL